MCILSYLYFLKITLNNLQGKVLHLLSFLAYFQKKGVKMAGSLPIVTTNFLSLNQTKKSVATKQWMICKEISCRLFALVATHINWIQLATVIPNEGKCSNCFNAMQTLNAMKSWRLLQDSIVYFTIFIFHEFSLARLCKTFVPINDLPWQKSCRKLLWAHLQTLWRLWSLIRF